MSSGKVHAGVARALLLPLSAAGVYLLPVNRELSIGWFVGAVAGLLITPDIDQEAGTTYEEWRVYQIGFIPGLIWQWLWWPYGKLFAHRGISHVYVIGTATRVVYLLFVIIPILKCFVLGWNAFYGSEEIAFSLSYETIPLWGYAGAFCSWCIQDAGHIFMDNRRRYLRQLQRTAWRIALIGGVFAVLWWAAK